MTESATSTAARPDLQRPLYGASFGQAFARFWRKYAVFTGRASRSEFWWSYLANALIVTAAVSLFGGAISVLVAVSGPNDGGQGSSVALVVVLGYLIILIGLVALGIPTLAALTRRYHDADKSGLLLLLLLIPYVGFIPVLILAVLPTEPRGARFDPGSNPYPYAPQLPPSGYPTAGASSAPYPGSPVPGTAPFPAPAWQSLDSASASAAAAAPSAIESRPAPLLRQPDLSRPPATSLADQRVRAAAARRAAWAAVGVVEEDALRTLLPSSDTAGPAWPGPRRAFVRVSTTSSLDIVASDGLTDGDGGGLGVELYLALQRATASPGWRESVLVQTAQNLASSGVRAGDELARHGALSMSLPGIDAPEDWRGAGDAVGVLLGVSLPSVPDRIALPSGSAALVGVVPLRPQELQAILAGGAPARGRVAQALSALTAQALTAPDRPPVA